MVSMQEDLEKNVTSAAIQGAQDISEFISLPVECFTTEVFRNIHSSVREMVLEGHDVSPVSVYEKMESTSTPLTLDAIFGLTNDYVLLDTQFAGLCKRLRSACDKRMVYNAVLEAAELAKDAQDAVEAKQTAIGRLLSIDDYGPRDHIFTLNDSLKSVIGSARDAFARPLEEKTKPVGVTTGIKSLDEILGGFHAGDLYILGAKTGRGKTVLGLNVAVAAAKSGKKVLYFSLEMKHEKILVAAVVGIWQFYIQRPSVEPAYLEKMAYPPPDKPSIPVLPFAIPTATHAQCYRGVCTTGVLFGASCSATSSSNGACLATTHGLSSDERREGPERRSRWSPCP